MAKSIIKIDVQQIESAMFFYKGASLGEVNANFFNGLEDINPLDFKWEFEDYQHYLDDCCNVIDRKQFESLSAKDQMEMAYQWSLYIYVLTMAGVLEDNEMNGIAIKYKNKPWQTKQKE